MDRIIGGRKVSLRLPCTQLVALGHTWSPLDLRGFAWFPLVLFALAWFRSDSLTFNWSPLGSLGVTWRHLVSLGFTWFHLGSPGFDGFLLISLTLNWTQFARWQDGGRRYCVNAPFWVPIAPIVDVTGHFWCLLKWGRRHERSH